MPEFQGSQQGPADTAAFEDMSPQQREAMLHAQGMQSTPFGMPLGQAIAQMRAAGMNEQQIEELVGDADVMEGLTASGQHYDGRQHAELKGFVTQNIDPGQLNEMSTILHGINTVLQRLSERMNESVGKTRHEWEGEAAENAFGYFGQMSTWADSTATNARLASEATYAQSNAAETAKNSMPEPVETHGLMGDFGEAMKSNPVNPIGAFQQAVEKREQADAAHQEAVQVMNTYDGNLYDAASKQPAYSPPPQFTNGGGGDGRIGGGTGVIDIPGDATTSASGFSGGPTGGAPVIPGGGGPGNVSGPAGGNPGVVPTPMPGNTTGQGQVGTGPGGANAPAARMPTGTPGAGAGFGGMGPVGPVAGGGAAGGNTPYNSKLGRPAAAGGFGPTGSGSGSAAGAAKGAAGAAGGAPGAGSGSGAAKPGMGGAGAGPGAAAAAGGGARGAGGAGMMGGAGARPNQQGGDEEEHQRPSWLVEADPDSLFGTDQRTAPPVIGE
ncbi:hypothetical protein BJF85_19660 [Saccharomonospora sp. CUA-673]|uniref:PPE domain-containing protein n=1 Tax=Saccharomonospora sp. CUA-673 TaxID=1904969 RepID=UPI00096359F3|nr:hypothetical protein [Saccharomonospora sp. CUA-673]OLT44696.1 hypothetical protein BJF85_19660 [Saccharomonospora sp. CUA-673]